MLAVQVVVALALVASASITCRTIGAAIKTLVSQRVYVCTRRARSPARLLVQVGGDCALYAGGVRCAVQAVSLAHTALSRACLVIADRALGQAGHLEVEILGFTRVAVRRVTYTAQTVTMAHLTC